MKKKIKNEIKDKVIGAFLGVAIGDALGMPVETFSAEKIAEKYGRVTDYLMPDGHKWFDGEEAGTTTDDTQLTLAVTEAMIASPSDMDSQAEFHKAAFRDTTSGWGRSTKESVRSLCNGASWKNSATSTGLGNGVAMKVSSLGLLSPQFLFKDDADSLFVKDLTFMTHKTDLALSSAFSQICAVKFCFSCFHDKNNRLPFAVEDIREGFQGTLGWACARSESLLYGEVAFTGVKDKLKDRFAAVGFCKNCGNPFDTDYHGHYPLTSYCGQTCHMSKHDLEESELPDDRFDPIKVYNGGGCYAYDSLPFAYHYFLKNPLDIESLYDVVSAGGDTDTNGSMVGALLGALNGKQIFPQHLIDGLKCKDEILDVANRFHETFFNSGEE